LNFTPESVIKHPSYNANFLEDKTIMEENQAGITALVTAYARAYHATHDSPLIFNDFMADQFYTKDEHISFDHHLAETLKMIAPELEAQHPDQATALAYVMQRHNGPITLSRSRYAEDSLDKAIQQGVQQYVILGAGFDTFAFRRPELKDRLQIFEVDHPTTQALKRQRIATAIRQLPAHLHFVPVNFTHESLVDALKNSAYNPEKLSFFSWLGVTYYLTHDAIETTLQSIVKIAPSGSQIIFDYLDADAFIPEKANRRVQLLQNIARMVGEPMKSGFEPEKLAQKLNQLKLNLHENLGPSDIEKAYFQDRNDQYHAFEHIHFVNASIL
jgi:methyltransferase (TIGR00027 family)